MAEEYKLCVDCVLSNLISMLVTSLVQLTDVNINRQRQHGRFRKIKINRTIVRIVVKSSFVVHLCLKNVIIAKSTL